MAQAFDPFGAASAAVNALAESVSPASGTPADFTWIVVVGGITCFLTAFAIGANDVANTFSSSVGSRAIPLWAAIAMSAVLETLGATLLGGAVTDSIRSKIIDFNVFRETPSILMTGMLCALVGAGLWLFLANHLSLPVSTTHSIVGALLGFGLASGNVHAVKWRQVAFIVGSWIVAPLAASLAGASIFVLMRGLILRSKHPLVRAKRFLWIFIWLITLTFSVFLVFKNFFEISTTCDQLMPSGEVIASYPCRISQWADAHRGISIGIALGLSIFLAFVISMMVYRFAFYRVKKYRQRQADKRGSRDAEARMRMIAYGDESACRDAVVSSSCLPSLSPPRGKLSDEVLGDAHAANNEDSLGTNGKHRGRVEMASMLHPQFVASTADSLHNNGASPLFHSSGSHCAPPPFSQSAFSSTPAAQSGAVAFVQTATHGAPPRDPQSEADAETRDSPINKDGGAAVDTGNSASVSGDRAAVQSGGDKGEEEQRATPIAAQPEERCLGEDGALFVPHQEDSARRYYMQHARDASPEYIEAGLADEDDDEEPTTWRGKLYAKWRSMPWFKDIHAECSDEDELVARLQTGAENFDTETELFFSACQVVSAFMGCIAHSANDTANAIGPFAAILTVYQTGGADSEIGSPWYILLFGGLSMSLGLALLGYRVIKTVGVKLVKITPARGFSMELGAAWTVLIFSAVGVPLSTTHCAVGSTVGVGLMEPKPNTRPDAGEGVDEDEAAGFNSERCMKCPPTCPAVNTASVNWKLFGGVFVSWIVTIAFSALVTAALFSFAAFSPRMV
ncbi:putative phosphate transporter family protein [Besnoitia besnoiti]|uniref:Phosphate transporter n=1 Tax=Besnoitia besnoiti TaxID=94643 RepID=A0A2A9M595_BESBE|nr:putative phosphate transporter family protein [Besnoitia besnoiti]PFH32374.1 putative phosphate transporter family protein [Besnoitia besnoiti]